MASMRIAASIRMVQQPSEDRLERYQDGPRALRRTRSHGLLAELIEASGMGLTRDFGIEYGPQGRPLAKGTGVPVVLSLSHSGRWLAAGVATGGFFGIDIEETRARPGRQAVADAYFGPAERLLVEQGDDRVFLALWTIREAFGKAIGDGISAALSLTDDQVVPALDAVHRISAAGQEWAIGHRSLGMVQLAAAWSIPDIDQLALALDGTTVTPRDSVSHDPVTGFDTTP